MRGKVVIVGAGPAGALAAIYMSKQNYKVEASMLPQSSHSSVTHPHLHSRLQQCIHIMHFCSQMCTCVIPLSKTTHADYQIIHVCRCMSKGLSQIQ